MARRGTRRGPLRALNRRGAPMRYRELVHRAGRMLGPPARTGAFGGTAALAGVAVWLAVPAGDSQEPPAKSRADPAAQDKAGPKPPAGVEEAPTGFDDKTNTFEDQTAFDKDKEAFEEEETILPDKEKKKKGG